MVTIMFTFAIGLTSLMFVLEKKEGCLERNCVAGVSTIELMIAHVFAKVLVMLVQITLLLIIAEFVFNVISTIYLKKFLIVIYKHVNLGSY